MFDLSPNSGDKPDPKPPHVTLFEEKEVSFEYTEHVVEVGFTTGDSKTFKFDKMTEKSDAYVLSDYTDGLDAGCGQQGEVQPDGSKKVTTIQKQNMTFIDTVERTPREMNEQKSEQYHVPLPEALFYVEKDPEIFSIDKSNVSEEQLEQWDACNLGRIFK